MDNNRYLTLVEVPPGEQIRIQEQTRLLALVKGLQGLSVSEKLKTLHEFKDSPWYGWTMLTLLALQKQAENFIANPPVGIEGLMMREQGMGEVNGLKKLQFEVDEITLALLEEKAEMDKPKEQEENTHED